MGQALWWGTSKTRFSSVSRLLLALSRNAFRPLARPALDLAHSPRATFYGEYYPDRLSRSRSHLVTVPEQELVRDSRGGTLVTADLRVILNQTEIECSGLPNEVCILERSGLLPAGWGRFDEGAVEDAVAPLAEQPHQADVEEDGLGEGDALRPLSRQAASSPRRPLCTWRGCGAQTRPTPATAAAALLLQSSLARRAAPPESLRRLPSPAPSRRGSRSPNCRPPYGA